jgi:hypothetical protein
MDTRQPDIYLANQQLRIKAYQRGTTDDFVARFGSSEKGETNLDLSKAATQKSFRGGMFQRLFEDPEMASTIKNAYYNKLDGNLYFSPQVVESSSTAMMGLDGATAYCFFNGDLYIAFRKHNQPAPTAPFNIIHRINLTTGALTDVTLPANLGNSSSPITDMVVHRTHIFICGKSAALGVSMPVFRMNALTPNGFAELSSTATFRKLISFRDKLYGVGVESLWLITSEFNTGIFSSIRTIGFNESNKDSVNWVRSYNNAVYIGKTDGLYRFDGVDVAVVFDYRKNNSPTNFQFGDTYNGRMYFNIKNKLYEFDGLNNLREIQDFTEGHRIAAIVGGQDRLWISAVSNTGVPGSDKYTVGALSYIHSLFCYNGLGFFEYAQLPRTLTGYEGIAIIAANDQVFCVHPALYINGSLDVLSSGYYRFAIGLGNEFTINGLGNNRSFEVFGSEFDAGYPSVDKVLIGAKVSFDGLEANKSHLKLEVSAFLDGVWSSWATVWTEAVVPVSGDDFYLFDQMAGLLTAPLVGDRFKYRLTCSIDNGVTLTKVPRVRSVTLRYTLQPKMRLAWLFTVSLDSQLPQTPTAMRKAIYDSYRNKLPVLFYDADYTSVVSSVADVNTGTITVKGVNFLVNGDTVAIASANGFINRTVQNVAYDTVAQTTSFKAKDTGLRQSIGGSTDIAITAGAKVRRSHAVQVRRVSSERYILDVDTINEVAGASDIESDLTLDLVEV